jgi:hypothetical protein
MYNYKIYIMSNFKAEIQFVEIYGKDVVNGEVETVVVHKNKNGTFTFRYEGYRGMQHTRYFRLFHAKKQMFLSSRKHTEHGARLIQVLSMPFDDDPDSDSDRDPEPDSEQYSDSDTEDAESDSEDTEDAESDSDTEDAESDSETEDAESDSETEDAESDSETEDAESDTEDAEE